MRLRTAAIMMIALTTFAVPAGLAAARPLPDPPPALGAKAVVTEGREGLTAALAERREVYRTAPWPDRRTIHNEIVLLLETGRAAL